MAVNIEETAAWLGVSVPVFRFLACFLVTFPCCWLWHFVPGAKARHLYSGLTGLMLSYYAFGLESNLHFLAPVLMGYISMVLCRRHCGSITFVTAFTYLIGCHIYYMSGDSWRDGGIDCTGALMVLTLKVISGAINYQDGLLKEEDLRPTQRQYRLLRLPSLLQYLGFCLCCGTHFAGPVYEMKDYLDWTENKGIWRTSNGGRSRYGGAIQALARALLCLGVYMYLVPRVQISRIFEPQYREWGIWSRWGYYWLCGFTARWKYYFIWTIAEASLIISGFGFSGWTDSSPPKPTWDRAKNVNIIGVEFAASGTELPLVWNIHVSTWLRLYVYDRLSKKGKKPGFTELLITQTVSAVWHGLYAGYILFFIHTALLIAGSRVIYRWQRAIPKQLVWLKKVGWCISFSYTVFILNYACIGFLVLSVNETVMAYSSLYYAGSVLPLLLLIFDAVVNPPRPEKQRLMKAESVLMNSHES
eukprot:c9421_g1_i1 orf=269-1687(+)